MSVEVATDDPTEGATDVTTLVFTATNWASPQVVTVTGLADGEADGDTSYLVVLSPAESADGSFDGLDPDDVLVLNRDVDGGMADTGDSDTIWVQGGCECNASTTRPAAPWLLALLVLPILRRRRSC